MPDKVYVTVKAAIVKDGKLLLQKERNHKGEVVWDLPGGRIDAGEDIHEGLAREIYEESGVKLKNVSELPVKTWSVKNTTDGFVALLYRADLENEEFDFTTSEVVEVEAVEYMSTSDLEGTTDHLNKPFIIEYLNELAE